MMQRYDQAIELLRKVVELDQNFPSSHERLGWVYAQQGKFDDAINELQKVRQIVGANNPYSLGELGRVYAIAGKREEAITILNQLLGLSKQGFTLSVEIAMIYAGLGEKNKAFEWLEKGFEEHNSNLQYLEVDHVWDDLHYDPRYSGLLKKMGLEK